MNMRGHCLLYVPRNNSPYIYIEWGVDRVSSYIHPTHIVLGPVFGPVVLGAPLSPLTLSRNQSVYVLMWKRTFYPICLKISGF